MTIMTYFAKKNLNQPIGCVFYFRECHVLDQQDLLISGG